MGPSRPPTSGYARIAQAEEEESSDSDAELGQSYASLQPAHETRFAPIQNGQPRLNAAMASEGSNTPNVNAKRLRHPRRNRSNSSGVDIKAINARLEKWADEIAAKFKPSPIRGKTQKEESLEIHYSVFQAPEGVHPITADQLAAGDGSSRMTKAEFDAVVESVQVAIEQGMHPKMITQGSSGSYFARNSEGKTVGVFKPKDEEPYAAGNPKWNKWIHRNLFPCFFGRACLIPNLSYVSEAAAYTLDCQLRTNLVPYTDIVHLASKSFHYNFMARRAYYKGTKPFPSKPGSFQVFLKGFSDANIFLRQHPWPDQVSGGLRATEAPKRKTPWSETCRPSGAAQSDDEDEEPQLPSADERRARRFFWTETLQQSFREELEKLVILDYIMRNTDRGLDNWMIKVDWETQTASIVAEPPKMPSDIEEEEDGPRPVQPDGTSAKGSYRQQQPMSSMKSKGKNAGPVMTIGAIDNSLSWPWKHPDAWRSFPFGWLFLPVSLIGRPFSQKTRDHFLPLLTSKQWWSETQLALRKVFAQDSDFQERMFARQIAVMKGQAWNVVETLKIMDHGPLELTRRARVCVWDDLVDIPVAMPMKAPSFEMRRRIAVENAKATDNEMDISSANDTVAPVDLLGLASPAADLPNPNRFELSSPRASMDPLSRSNSNSPNPQAVSKGVSFAERPTYDKGRSRQSYTGPSRTTAQTPPTKARRYSLSNRRGSSSFVYDGEDLEGDLGYAAAEDMEGNHRKVIVERLETVKSKNPVFTWC